MKPRKTNLNEALQVLKKRKKTFEENFGITSLGIFGSIAKGQNSSDSDVDIVVKMSKPNLFYMVHIKEALETDYQRKVDIVHYRDKMNSFLKKRIDLEAVYA